MSNSQNRGNRILLLAGIAVGAAAGYYLNSEKGREMRSNMQKKSNEWSNTLAEKSTEMVENAKLKANDALAKANSKLGEMKEQISLKTTQAEIAANEQVDNFQEGVDKAKAKLNSNVNA